ncbi:hypothetical protein F4604DRAFT_1936020 [Suillus subluteus]|nr:hypothetical protein F4604DRAFT_1936020 [Suillus subluteus]
MPKSDKKTNKHHRLNALGHSMTDLHHQFSAHKRKECVKWTQQRYKMNPMHQKNKHLISKPKGHAGRKDGYKLTEAMGLSDRKEHYNVLDRAHMLADRYLKENVTISGQDKFLVQNVIRKAQSTSCTLQKFDQGWPIYDMLAQYLRNRSAYKKKKNRLQDFGSDSDSDSTDSDLDTTDSDSDSADSDSDPVDSDSDSETKKAHVSGADTLHRGIVRLSTANKMIPRKTSTSKQTAVKSSQKLVQDDTSDAEASTIKLTRLKRYNDTYSDVEAKRVTFLEQEEPAKVQMETREIPGAPSIFDSPASGRRPSIFDQDSDNSELEPLRDPGDNDKFVSSHDIPTVCPNDRCNDMIPRSPSSKLYDHWKPIICKMIKDGVQREIHLNDAVDQGWPILELDFRQIPARVSELKKRLDIIIFASPPSIYDLKASPFSDCLEDIAADGLTLQHLMDIAIILKDSRVLANTLPGYYGPKGKAIIKASLFRMYPPEFTPNNLFHPLRTEKFLEYFGACDIVSKSLDHGAYIFLEEDDDDELDEILHCIMIGVRDDHRERERLSEAEKKQPAKDEALRLLVETFGDIPSPKQNKEVDPVVQRKPKKVGSANEDPPDTLADLYDSQPCMMPL